MEKDIQNLFIKYIRGEINSLPWCDESLGSETGAIYQRLCEINERGYWTVSSQPAVNGASSQDAVYGWGPKGGYVYQKAFLEFFVSDTQIEELLVRLTRDDSITFYATNQKVHKKKPLIIVVLIFYYFFQKGRFPYQCLRC